MFIATVRTQRKSHTATKNADSSGHRPNFPTTCFGVSLPTDWNVWLSASDWQLWGLIPSWLTLCLGLTNVLRSLFRSRRFSHSSVCGFRATSKMPEIRFPPWLHIYEHSQRPTHTHPYIYIHTHECSLSRHTRKNYDDDNNMISPVLQERVSIVEAGSVFVSLFLSLFF